MSPLYVRATLFGLMVSLAVGTMPPTTRAADPPGYGKGKAGGQADERAGKPDSYYYYGPSGLWKRWHDKANKDAAAQRLGRDTWIHWTWGNQKFLRRVTVLAGGLPVPVSLDFFRLLDSRKRGTRFRDFGLINEPNCEQNNEPDPYGLYLDRWKGDPLGYYPGQAAYKEKYPLHYPETDEPVNDWHYGRPTGVVGLRLFDNPKFDRSKWSAQEYFRNPGKIEPPYLAGFSCAFCHMGFDPNNPPRNPEKPRWENLAANIGNQYFREGDIMLGRGRLLFGDKHPDPASPSDPYRTRGLAEEDFLFHYAVTQQPGTSETSRISYDFINNPNTINSLFALPSRRLVKETNSHGKPRDTWLILKDGADSIGVRWALMRVPINIGCEGEYWISRLFNPATGQRQRPFRIADVLARLSDKERKRLQEEEGLTFQDVTPQRLAELDSQFTSAYGKQRFGEDWQEAWRRAPAVAAYLTSYPAAHVADAVSREAQPSDGGQLKRGARLFGLHCARCHSSKRPPREGSEEQESRFFEESAQAADFLDHNYLADERRHSVKVLGTNMARALATNAVDADIWAEFSSRDYKALPPLGRIPLDVPVFDPNAPLPWSVKRPIHIDFEPPGGGRGYYRTPSLVSMWATAPYLHNNAVGDYYVAWDKGGKGWVSNDGTRWRANRDDAWQARLRPFDIDYRIDTSVEGRLKMFEDGVEKLLDPSKRSRWVKRTTTASALVPDLENSARQLLTTIIRDVIRRELVAWLTEQQIAPELAAEVVQAAEPILDRAIQLVLQEGRVSMRFGWEAVQMRLRDHADRLFDWLYDDLRGVLASKLRAQRLALGNLKPLLRKAILSRLDRLDERLRQAAILKVPAGTPINLYANLSSSALIYAALAHVEHRDDPRALAEALLRLSDCPDFVEDSGHLYGSDLSPKEKKDLQAFLKTF